MSAALLLLLAVLPASAQEEGETAQPGLLRMGGLNVYSDTTAPLSFVTLTPNEVPEGAVRLGEVTARGCQHGVAVPITASFQPTTISGAGGDGSYAKALAGLKKRRPEIRGLYDVKADFHLLSILGFYRRLCVVITARAFK